MAAAKQWFPFQWIQNPEETDIALIKLNTPFVKFQNCFTLLWKRAVLKTLVDGAVNELYKSADFPKEDYIPDLITGDFDSAKSEALNYYKSKNVDIIETPDQSETDFTKSLRVVCDKLRHGDLKVSSICVHVSFAGRPDHIMANMNTLFLAKSITDIPIYLNSGDSTVFLLDKGRSAVNVGDFGLGAVCGLIPLNGPCNCVTTTGLKWNLNRQPMNFGGIVSSSNEIVNDVVTVESDNSILMSITIEKLV